DGYTCTYLPSIHLGLSRPAAASYQQMLVVENPKSTFSIRGKNKKLDDLPFAEIEAELVRQSMLQHLTTAPTTVKAREAQREKVIAKLEEAHQIFHFTGHGVYDAADPAASCLFLSGPDTLDLNDIIELDLSHCPLVCLAACETAVTGNQTITDEYVGLVSAFLKAGVSHVVSTLWRVESAASAMLVVKFYEQLQADQPPEIALREAQTFLRQATRQQVIAQTKAMLAKLPPALAPTLRTRLKALRESKIEYPYAHPYFWAAFSISGL
ncbi:MAG: CHAT domain-containing protein, partial [Cyanobacteria bacterium P01_A01_bin.135]